MKRSVWADSRSVLPKVGQDAIALMMRRPAELGRMLGYDRLTDELHGRWMRDIIAGEGDLTLQAHRGSFKTTCLCVALAVIMALRPENTIMFLRKTDGDVAEVIRQVARILRHPDFRRLTEVIYGQGIEISRENASEITTNFYAAPRGAAQLLGIGIGGSLTGKHADLVVTDDIVNLRDRVSPVERDRTRAAYMELQNIRNPGGRIVNTGTPWHPDDAFSLMPEPQRFDCYATGLLSGEQIEGLRQRMAPSLFAANYELRHLASEEALFPGPPRFVSDPGVLRDGIAHLDAAYGGGDYTALTCAKRVGDTVYLYGRLWRAHVDTVLRSVLEECGRLMCAPLYVETNADKGFLAREIRRAGMPVRMYHEDMNKYVKISTFLRKWWDRVVFVEGTDAGYVGQILDYGEGVAHDDAPDGAACVCRVMDRGFYWPD